MADAKKPGWKTTEFWLTSIYALVAILNGSGALHYQIPLETVAAAGQGIAVYVASRSVTKAAGAYLTAKAQPAKLNQ